MEHLSYLFKGGTRALPRAADVVGVVGSGNLEVLIETAPLQGGCSIDIATAAVGFGAIWEAVMTDFHARWQLMDARIAINDMGATPAVVSLRLEQAVETMLERP
jgi:malonate decarboxylase delta subunit